MRVNSVAVLFVGLASAAFPIHAEQTTIAPPQADISAIGARAAVALPDYVPVINYDQFLLASRGDGFDAGDNLSAANRSAAEALSAKFFGSSGGTRSGEFHLPFQPDPVNSAFAAAPDDPKQEIRLASATGADEFADPVKTMKPAQLSESRAVSETKTATRRERRSTREVAANRAKAAKRGHSRPQRNRVASAGVAPRSGSAYNGIGADLERLVGFGSLSTDHRMTN